MKSNEAGGNLTWPVAFCISVAQAEQGVRKSALEPACHVLDCSLTSHLLHTIVPLIPFEHQLDTISWFDTATHQMHPFFATVYLFHMNTWDKPSHKALIIPKWFLDHDCDITSYPCTFLRSQHNRAPLNVLPSNFHSVNALAFHSLSEFIYMNQELWCIHTNNVCLCSSSLLCIFLNYYI